MAKINDILGKHQRSFIEPKIDVKREDDGEKLYTVAVATETPYIRWGVSEILKISKSSVNMERLNTKASLLWNHNSDEVIGVVERAWISNDKVLRANVRFGNSAKAKQIQADVNDGIISKISVGYNIKEAEWNDEEHTAYTVTKWEPMEVSFVSVPADNNAGLNKSTGDNTMLNKNETPFEITEAKKAEQTPTPTPTPTPTANDTTLRQPNDITLRQPNDITLRQVKDELAKAQMENKRVSEITAIAFEYNRPQDEVQGAIKNGMSVEQYTRNILVSMTKKSEPVQTKQDPATVGEHEIKAFSMGAIIKSAYNPNDIELQKRAGESWEILGQYKNRANHGWHVPTTLLMGQKSLQDAMEITRKEIILTRMQTVGTPSDGGHIVRTDERGIIDLLFPDSILPKLGVHIETGLTGDLEFEREVSYMTVGMHAEGGITPLSDMTFGVDKVTPVDASGQTKISRKLLKQTDSVIERRVYRAMQMQMSKKMQEQALYGDGSGNNAKGWTKFNGVQSKTFTTKQKPTFEEFVNMQKMAKDQYVNPSTIGYLSSTAIWQHATITAVESGDSKRLLENGVVAGRPFMDSTYVNANDLIFADWSQVWLGLWDGMEFDFVKDTTTNGGVVVQGWQMFSTYVYQPKAIVVGTKS